MNNIVIYVAMVRAKSCKLRQQTTSDEADWQLFHSPNTIDIRFAQFVSISPSAVQGNCQCEQTDTSKSVVLDDAAPVVSNEKLEAKAESGKT
eukprot:4127578-Amphidinium_carterae.1